MAEELDPFVGRAVEIAALRRVLADVDAGRPQTVLLTGPAGIGKTSLIEQFLSELDGATVLRASGEQWEAFVAFGVMDQLLRAAGVRSGLLLASRQRALPPEEPVGVGAVVLEALEELERQSAVVLLIDDAHWADVDSLRALLFALRRLVTARVLTLLAVRDEDAARLPEGFRRLASGRTGRLIRLEALESGDIQTLATALGVPQFRMRTAQRLRDHTGGNPLYVRSLLSELPVDRWNTWQPLLPAPRVFVTQVMGRLSACSPAARALVEACSVLGVRTSLHMAAALAQVDDQVGALEEAVAVGLLQTTDRVEIWGIAFPHPLVQAAVYEHVSPTSRVRLHRAASELVDDAGAALRHRVAATTPPNDEVAAALDAFARREMRWGAWASAASALVEASRMSVEQAEREERLLRAIDAIVSAGDLVQASGFTRDVARFEPGPLRDAALGYLSILRGRAAEAEALLSAGWQRADPAADPHLAALLALRWTLHSVGRLRGAEIVEWSRRAVALVPDDGAVRLESDAILGLGFGLTGRVRDGLAAYESVLAPMTGGEGSLAQRVAMPEELAANRRRRPRRSSADAGRGGTRPAPQRIDPDRRVVVRVVVAVPVPAGEWDAAAAAAERALARSKRPGTTGSAHWRGGWPSRSPRAEVSGRRLRRTHSGLRWRTATTS